MVVTWPLLPAKWAKWYQASNLSILPMARQIIEWEEVDYLFTLTTYSYGYNNILVIYFTDTGGRTILDRVHNNTPTGCHRYMWLRNRTVDCTIQHCNWSFFSL